ncbi:MAG TPA: FAD-dependent oxidoreductase [Anaeromyxobacteraceae bacterium]|nr:FAD-dependent oxidoreductase [Anaeromyxobacteraceae bacterium]
MGTIGQPVILAVDDDESLLGAIERELRDRYARHYRVTCVRSPAEARPYLAECASTGVEVALVLAGRSAASTSEFLAEVRKTHPGAKRALAVGFGDWGRKAVGEEIFEGVADGRFDHYVLRPGELPDELFHQTITSMLLEWWEGNRVAPNTVHIVGESWTGRAHELREALKQCAVVHHFCLADSDEGRALVASAPRGAKLPLVVFPNGLVLQNPSNAEVALAAGGAVNPERVDFDVVIVGGGPAGLSAAVYGASEGFRTLVVDKGGIGGQATSSSLIRNYLGFPRGISGRQLAQSAYNQAWVFGAEFVFMQSVTGLARDGKQLVVTLSESGQVRCSAVILAMGARYRRLDVAPLEALVGAGVFYGSPTSEASAFTGRDVFIVGGANSAGQAALHLARFVRSVTLVIRADSLRAGMSEYLARQIEATDTVKARLGCQVVGGGGEGRLEHLVLRDVRSQAETTVPAHALFLLIGAQPNTEWLPPEVVRDEQGFVLTGSDVSQRRAWVLDRSPFLLESSMPSVFAVGDVRHGAVKRVASAVGEGSIAIQFLHHLFAVEGLQARGRPREHPGTPA